MGFYLRIVYNRINNHYTDEELLKRYNYYCNYCQKVFKSKEATRNDKRFASEILRLLQVRTRRGRKLFI